MDPPIINEASFSAANPSSYSLAEIWPFSTAANGGGNGDLGGGGLGLRMSSFTGLLEAAMWGREGEDRPVKHFEGTKLKKMIIYGACTSVNHDAIFIYCLSCDL